METYTYLNERMERELLKKIDASATKRYGNAIPADIANRIAMEECHAFGTGSGTVLAAAAKLAEFSAERGYPVGFRGAFGNLYITHLLGIASLDPMALDLRWEGFFGPSKNWRQPVNLNVAPALLEDMTAYLGMLLPGYDPNAECPDIRLCPHALMDLAGEVQQQTGSIPAARDIISDESLILRAYHDDVSGIPVLDDLDGFQDFAHKLKPKTFQDLEKTLGLCLSPYIWFQAEHFADQPDPFDGLIGTREDVYDICVQHGIDPDDAFCIMQRVGRGGSGKLTQEHKDMLASHEFPDVFMQTLDAVDYIYPRGHCADYLYWALVLLSHQTKN